MDLGVTKKCACDPLLFLFFVLRKPNVERHSICLSFYLLSVELVLEIDRKKEEVVLKNRFSL